MATKRLRRSPEQARAEILDAAGELLRSRRFNELTVELIMNCTGMTRSSFYHYFDSIDAVAGALVERYETALRASLEPWLSEHPDRREAIRENFVRMLYVIREHGHLMRAAAQAAENNRDARRSWHRAVLDPFIERTTYYIEREVEAGNSRVRDPARISRALILLNNTLSITSMHGKNAETPETLGELLADLWTSVIYGQVPEQLSPSAANPQPRQDAPQPAN